MRILHVTPAYRPSIGGIEEVVRGLALRLASLGIDAGIAHVASSHARFECEREGNLPVYRIPLRGNRLMGIAPSLWSTSRAYDLLHVHDPQLMAITANSWPARLPAVLSTHGGFRHTNRFARVKRLHELILMRSALRRYEEVLAVSSSDLDYFSRYHPSVVLAPNGVSIERFLECSPRSTVDPCNWLYWGRIAPNKRVDLLIAVVGTLRDLGVDVCLTIAGPADVRTAEALKSQIAADRLQGQVRFVGKLGAEEIVSLAREHSVFVSASEYEGFGLTIVEAMACGLIPVVRNAAPMNGFVGDGAEGILVDFSSTGEAASKILQALWSPRSSLLSMSIAAAERADNYSWDKAAPAIVASYRRVLGL